MYLNLFTKTCILLVSIDWDYLYSRFVTYICGGKSLLFIHVHVILLKSSWFVSIMYVDYPEKQVNDMSIGIL